MIITVRREWFTSLSSQGEMLIDGEFFCYTLEPRADRSEGKPYCIPQGMYPITLEWSNRFKRNTPHVGNVLGFEDIEIHPGNRPGDTHGCILVGSSKEADWVSNSVETFNQLMLRVLNGAKLIVLGGPTL